MNWPESSVLSIAKMESLGVGPSLDLSGLPPVFVLNAHLSAQELHSAEDNLEHCRAPLTYDIHEAKIIFASLSKAKRVKFELQKAKVLFEDLAENSDFETRPSSAQQSMQRNKRTKLSPSSKAQSAIQDSSTETETSNFAPSHRYLDSKPISSESATPKQPLNPFKEQTIVPAGRSKRIRDNQKALRMTDLHLLGLRQTQDC